MLARAARSADIFSLRPRGIAYVASASVARRQRSAAVSRRACRRQTGPIQRNLKAFQAMCLMFVPSLVHVYSASVMTPSVA